MPVSTDGVLLGSWVNLTQEGNLLDIGTGTGLLSLMCAQRYPQWSIEAIDIDPHALDAAQINFSQSAWAKRLKLHQGDVLNFPCDKLFSAIICNPPYFNNGAKAQDHSRATARHTVTLDHQALLDKCWQLLAADGSAHFILPITEGEQFIQAALTCGWQLKRRCDVQPNQHKPVHRLLIELSKQASTPEYQSLLISDNDGYSADFIQLTKAFYLNM